jgi:hypothetical protein
MLGRPHDAGYYFTGDCQIEESLRDAAFGLFFREVQSMRRVLVLTPGFDCIRETHSDRCGRE